MSIKLYYGYKLPSMSAYELQCFFEKLRKKLNKERDKMYDEALASEFISAFDSVWLGVIDYEGYKNRFKHTLFTGDEYIKDKISLYNFVVENIRENYREIYKTGRRNPSYDFQFTVSVIPTKDKTLCVIYTEQNEFREIWENMKEVEEYGYWNNTDQPEDVTDKEWRFREKEWEKALKNWGPPVLAGFSWNMNPDGELDGFPFFGDSGFEKVIKLTEGTKHKRALHYAKRILLDKKMKQIQQEKGIKKEDIKEISDSGYWEASDFVRSEEGQKIAEEMALNIEQKLVEITEDHKRMSYSDIVQNRPQEVATFLESL